MEDGQFYKLNHYFFHSQIKILFHFISQKWPSLVTATPQRALQQLSFIYRLSSCQNLGVRWVTSCSSCTVMWRLSLQFVLFLHRNMETLAAMVVAPLLAAVSWTKNTRFNTRLVCYYILLVSKTLWYWVVSFHLVITVIASIVWVETLVTCFVMYLNFPVVTWRWYELLHLLWDNFPAWSHFGI